MLDVIGLVMHRHAPIRTNEACKRPMMIAPKPAIRLHGSRQRRERGQRWERLERRLIATCLPRVEDADDCNGVGTAQ
jgi:hypothetical protein